MSVCNRARSMLKAALVSLAVLACLAPLPARAEEPAAPVAPADRWPINQQDPAKSVPSTEELEKTPLKAGYLLMDMIDLADQAVKAKRYPDALKYYGTIARMVPERATAFSKLCEVYAAMDDTPHAIENCRLALGKPGARVGDAALLARLLSDNVGGPTPAEVAELDDVIAHLKEQKVAPEEIALIQCGIGARLSDARRLKECTATLNGVRPEDPKTISYLFTLALVEGDYSAAQRALTHARAAGVPAAGLQQMEAALRSIRFAWIGKLAKALGVLAVLVILFVGARALFRRTTSKVARA